ncbi:serine/threonine-protein kinase [Hahella ganghwensis]|uniref:serine/threonine-protein kinase n=1 Tax=Hahella ganghwensis TaxID=286420 RepID=UPI00035D3891|nr:protein kinase [Hahella ganghwensis]
MDGSVVTLQPALTLKPTLKTSPKLNTGAFSSRSASKAFAVGQIINDRYLLVEKACFGGAFIVYKAQDLYRLAELQQNYYVAIKTLRQQWVDCEEAVNTLRYEADLLQQIRMESVVRSHTSGSEDGVPYMLLEWVEGRSLKAILNDATSLLRVQDKRRILWQLATTIRSLHQQGIIHGDINPANIYVKSDGSTCLINFGAAHLRGRSGSEPRLRRASLDFVIKNHNPAQAPDMEGDWYALLQVLRCLYFGKARTRMRPRPGMSFFQIRALRKALWKLERRKMPDWKILDEILGIPIDQLSQYNQQGIVTAGPAQASDSIRTYRTEAMVVLGIAFGYLAASLDDIAGILKILWMTILSSF